jgi:hypothetical protein
LLVYRRVSFAGDLPILESIAAKFFWQRLVGMAFLTPSLSRSTRFTVAGSINFVADTRQGLFYI